MARMLHTMVAALAATIAGAGEASAHPRCTGGGRGLSASDADEGPAVPPTVPEQSDQGRRREADREP